MLYSLSANSSSTEAVAIGCLAICLAATLALAAVAKALSANDFAATLARLDGASQIKRRHLAASQLVIGTEVVGAFALVTTTGIAFRITAFLNALLFVGFLAAVETARRRKAPCGCFGRRNNSGSATEADTIRTLYFASIAILLAILATTSQAPAPALAPLDLVAVPGVLLLGVGLHLSIRRAMKAAREAHSQRVVVATEIAPIGASRRHFFGQAALATVGALGLSAWTTAPTTSLGALVGGGVQKRNRATVDSLPGSETARLVERARSDEAFGNLTHALYHLGQEPRWSSQQGFHLVVPSSAGGIGGTPMFDGEALAVHMNNGATMIWLASARPGGSQAVGWLGGRLLAVANADWNSTLTYNCVDVTRDCPTATVCEIVASPLIAACLAAGPLVIKACVVEGLKNLLDCPIPPTQFVDPFCDCLAAINDCLNDVFVGCAQTSPGCTAHGGSDPDNDKDCDFPGDQ